MALSTARATVILRDLTMRFDNAVRAATPLYPNIATVVPSNRSEEKYGWLGSLPGMREWLGERKFKELRGADYTLKNKLWESSLFVERTDYEDDEMGMYGPLIDDLAAEASYHPDELLFTIINNGHTGLAFDGQNFFDTDHVWGDSGTQDNDLTTAAATGTVPTVAEFKTAYNSAVAALVGFKNDQGKLLNRPDIMENGNLLLMVPPGMRATAIEALTAQVLNNNSNVVIDQPTRILTSGYLTNSAVFYLFNLSPGGIRPFIFQARQPLRRQVKGLTDDIEFKEAKFMVEARYNVGYGAWWRAIRMEFT